MAKQRRPQSESTSASDASGVGAKIAILDARSGMVSSGATPMAEAHSVPPRRSSDSGGRMAGEYRLLRVLVELMRQATRA